MHLNDDTECVLLRIHSHSNSLSQTATERAKESSTPRNREFHLDARFILAFHFISFNDSYSNIFSMERIYSSLVTFYVNARNGGGGGGERETERENETG